MGSKKTTLQVNLAAVPPVTMPDLSPKVPDGEVGHDLLIANQVSSESIH